MEEVMRGSCLRLIIAAGIIAMPFAVQAHDPPDLILPAVQFPDGNTPIMDGNVDDWAPVPEQYAVFGEALYPVGKATTEGRAQEFSSQGEIDASDMALKYLAGWNESGNNVYWYTEVFDDLHISRRQDPSKFFWDDSVEYQFNYNHEATEDQNQGDLVTSVDYNYALPPVDGAFEYYRPLKNLPWLVHGSRWIELGWSFTGDAFGTSTYFYEFRIAPIQSMPMSEDATESQVVEGDLSEGQIVHWGSMVNDVDETDGSFENREAQWSMAASGGNAADVTDLLLAPMDPSIVWGPVRSAVEATSWGRIKAQF
jgi:hypothetical protein